MFCSLLLTNFSFKMFNMRTKKKDKRLRGRERDERKIRERKFISFIYSASLLNLHSHWWKKSSSLIILVASKSWDIDASLKIFRFTVSMCRLSVLIFLPRYCYFDVILCISFPCTFWRIAFLLKIGINARDFRLIRIKFFTFIRWFSYTFVTLTFNREFDITILTSIFILRSHRRHKKIYRYKRS